MSNGEEAPHILLGCRQQSMWEGGRWPKLPSRYLPKIRAPSAFYPNFSFRQLPSASVSFRGLPWTSADNGQPPPHIFLGCIRRCISEGGRKPNVTGQYLPTIIACVAVYPDFGSHQLPPGSVDFRGIPRTMGNHLHIYIAGAQKAKYVGWGGEAKVSESKFT